MRSLCCILIWLASSLQAANLDSLSGWRFKSPRVEATPTHHISTVGGRDGQGGLTIETKEGNHWMGCWYKDFPVVGGRSYNFEAWRQFTPMPDAARRVVVRVLWINENGEAVTWGRPATSGYAKGGILRAEPEYPKDLGLGDPTWNRFASTLKAPPSAKQARVELILQWAPNAKATFSSVSWRLGSELPKRSVRLATIHLRPEKGDKPSDKPPQFAARIAEAARAGADLVVLPETLTYYKTGLRMDQCAEPVPGPTSAYFGALARKHNLYIVAGILERDKRSLYNSAILLGPDASLVGVYRKVCLPRGEIEAGLSPGDSYPVFRTRFGKVGMMICYDGFFPEVARELSKAGAEVIAWPVWGCNPLLAAARACENHVYVVSSTYSDHANSWMISGIFDHYGDVLAKAEKWDSIAITEVDLNQPSLWNSLGNFKAQLPSHTPPPSSDR